ncbi:glycosyltransferase [Winogradskyella litorisediminis]|uniref:Glycosyltransferase n=1 Tax=Winogradskyella litorisediminis TaxID=1156618 RepID=A0ABW3N7M0_9FLAO
MSKKICLLIDSLSSGGAERMVSNLSYSLVVKGYDVTTVIMRNEVEYNYSGKLYNFGLYKQKHSKLKAFRELKSYFKIQNFDMILDHRIRRYWWKEFLFSKAIFRPFKVIYCVHHYKLWMYFPKVNNPWLSKKTLVPNHKIVAVSQLAKSEIKKRLNLHSEVIYNYPEYKEIEAFKTAENYIIAVGRLEPIKQFDVLIECYEKSNLKDENFKLLIFGEGSQRQKLQDMIAIKNLENQVVLKGFSVNVSEYIKSAKALVMSSEGEGFPMVLIEAIQLKTPVISFNCKSGPSEIIENGINGILVDDQNKEALTAALNKIIDKEFYLELNQNLQSYKSPFTEQNIIKQWVNLIDNF